MQFQKGFMVFRNGKRGIKPRHIHTTIGEAHVEASRLALKAADEGSNDLFLVVEVIGGVRAKNGTIESFLPGEKNEKGP